jgi:uncharacterized protein (TIGR03067 family)
MRRLVLLSVVLALAFAPAPLPRPEQKRRPHGGGFHEIEGHWEAGGTKLEITPGRWTHSADCFYEMTIDTTSRPYKFDIHGIGGSNTGLNFSGIYKVEGDRLIMAYVPGKGSRPTSLDRPSITYVRVRR